MNQVRRRIELDRPAFATTAILPPCSSLEPPHIRGPETSTGVRRLNGYKQALAQAGRRVIDDYVITEFKGDMETKQRGAEAMRQLLSLKP
jgi:hypothetical protein